MIEPLFNVVLHEPEIPQNTGNIGRTCVATNSKLWIVRPTAFRLDDRNLRRSGLDYWQHLNWSDVSNWEALAANVAPERIWYFSKRGRRCYTDAAYQRGDYLVFGSETKGLPPSLIEQDERRTLQIPMSTNVRSLNLSNSVAIVLYEALRQRGIDPSQSNDAVEDH